MIEKFKNIFEGLDRAHGVTIVGESNGNGTKIKGKSFCIGERCKPAHCFDIYEIYSIKS